MPNRAREAEGSLGAHGRVRWSSPWALSSGVVGALLLVGAIAVVLVADGLASSPLPGPVELRNAVVLCLLGVVHTEGSVRVERERRRLAAVGHVDLGIVWTFAAALVLPVPSAALVAIVLGFYRWARSWRRHVGLYRQLHLVAAVVFAVLATNWLRTHVDPKAEPGDLQLALLVLAVVVFAAVNACSIAVVTALGDSRGGASALLGRRDDVALEFGLLCLGALTAVALTTGSWLVVFVLPAVLALQRAVLIRPLAAAASTDGKTGLLNADTWLTEAGRVLRAPHTHACGVLVLDLDHFKTVNDTYGHVVGDRVLAAVADVLRRVVRAQDLVGRLGGEEFVVMPLAAAHGARSVELEVVAERIRAWVAVLQVQVDTPRGSLTVGGLTISVGGAVASESGSDLSGLLHAADAAMYAAKRAGRNRVRIMTSGLSPPDPGPRTGAAMTTQSDGPIAQVHPVVRSRTS
jgi:diguanylate cyclase (GGDEF)-like protein